MIRSGWLAALLLPSAAALAAPAALPVEEVRVPAGRYYVGRAAGERNYAALANATTPGFMVLRSTVSQRLFAAAAAWGLRHGYRFALGCAHCEDGAAAVVSIAWIDAALLANALSEANGLDPVYRDGAGRPVRDAATIATAVVEPSLSGYRLPTIPELQIALRGADRALADRSYGTPRDPNALGVAGAAGPVAEWTASGMDLGDRKPMRFFCNDTIDGVRRLSQCDIRSVGSSTHFVGFRLVRR